MRLTSSSMWQTFVRTAIAACVVLCAAPASAFGQAGRSIGQRYEAREPRVCADMTAPARGAITAAVALRYLNCQMEYESGDNLYLVDNVTVQVGGGISYAAIRGQRSFMEIDVRAPVYPIRGSLLRYQCSPTYGKSDPNCLMYDYPKATGYCFKTTFGDWKCHMSDAAVTSSTGQRVAPPKLR